MTFDQIIEQAGRANQQAAESNSAVLSALQSLQSDPRVSDQLVIISAMKALRRCVEAEGLSPGARSEVKSALAMCRSALGLE